MRPRSKILSKWLSSPLFPSSCVDSERALKRTVQTISYVSGVGEYTAVYNAAEGIDGAYLDLTYGIDSIGSIIVNGSKLLANNASDRIDLGALLTPGPNTITVKLSSALYGRMFVENSGYVGSDFGMGGGFMTPADPEMYYNGLLSATLTPYVLK